MLHRALGACEVARLCPGRLQGEEPSPIFGRTFEDALWGSIGPALEEAWSNAPERSEVEDLDAFLAEASEHLLEAAKALDSEEGFVPAAHFPPEFRSQLFEHLRSEVDLVASAVETEPLWSSFENYQPTAAITELVEAGLRIKLRAIGSFLVGPPPASRFDDEAAAIEFFPDGEWKRIRDEEVVERILIDQEHAHKQVAHLTLSRPFPEERRVYTSASFGPDLAQVMLLLNQFVEAVHPDLIPEWLPEWVKERTPSPPRTLDDLGEDL